VPGLRLVGHLGRAAATGCPHCHQAPAADCPEHSPDHAQIEAYRQLAADLTTAGGEQ
jgi:glutaredoxin